MMSYEIFGMARFAIVLVTYPQPLAAANTAKAPPKECPVKMKS